MSKVTHKVAWPPPLAGTIDKLIRNNVLNLSGASKFYKSKAHAATELTAFIEQLPGDEYRLKGTFAPWFRASLSVVVSGHPGGPSNCLADALYLLALHWARIDFGESPLEQATDPNLVSDCWGEIDSDWTRFCQSGGASGEWWMGRLKPEGSIVECSKTEPYDAVVGVRFDTDKGRLPRMNIEIAGRAATMFMRWWIRIQSVNSEVQTDQLQNRMTALCESLYKRLKIQGKLSQPKRGRPRLQSGERIAYLLDHEGKSPSTVARSLGFLKDSDIRHANDRINQARKLYYDSLRSELRNSLPVKSE